MALITVGDCLQRVPQAAGNEDILVDLIEEAEALAGNVCKRKLASASYTDYYDIGVGQAVVALRQAPTTETLVVQTGANSAAPSTLSADTDYTLDTDAGIISSLSGAFPTGSRNLKVTYTAGYTAAACPAGLRRVLYQLVGWLLESAGNAGVSSEGQDGYTAQYDPLEDGVPGNLARALNPWRKVVVG